MIEPYDGSTTRDGDEYIASDALSLYTGDVTDLVLRSGEVAPKVLRSELSALLGQCGVMATVAEHVSRLRKAGGQVGEAELLERDLEELRREGLLAARSQIIGGMRRTGAKSLQPKGAPIQRVCWVTRDRSAVLRRSIKSACSSLARCGKRPALAVFDDSAGVDGRKETQQGLASLGSECEFHWSYTGPREKGMFSERLLLEMRDSGAAEACVGFALADTENTGLVSTGANRNALLLFTAGEAVLSADDDVLFAYARSPAAPPRSMPEPSPDLVITSEGAPGDTWFFSDLDGLRAALSPGDLDILAMHESLLGRTPGECLPRQAEALSLEGVAPRFARFLEQGSGEVRVTMTGLCGDSGMQRAGMVLYLKGASRDRVVSSEGAYRSALLSRTILRCVGSPTIGEGSFLMTPLIGIDNRELLPPFVPVGRNADGLFGLTVRACVSDGLLGYVPAAVLHEPVTARRFVAEDLDDVVPDLSALLMLLLRAHEFPPCCKETADRILSLGEHFMRFGSLSEALFKAQLRELWTADVSRHILQLEGLIERYDARPAYWTEHVRSRIEALRAFASDDHADLPSDLRAGRSVEEARELTRRLVWQYGELLTWWPVIWETARRLNEGGEGMLAGI